jgi:hypothetical protein
MRHFIKQSFPLLLPLSYVQFLQSSGSATPCSGSRLQYARNEVNEPELAGPVASNQKLLFEMKRSTASVA